MAEIKKHNKINDCWIVLDSNVLNITNYLTKHPGGIDVILDMSGTDVTTEFEKICHSNSAYELSLQYKIGVVEKK